MISISASVSAEIRSQESCGSAPEGAKIIIPVGIAFFSKEASSESLLRGAGDKHAGGDVNE